METQRLPLLDFCRAQGWTEIIEYRDEGASATDLRARVAWRKLLNDAAKRRFDLVLVWRLDRMARSVLDAAQTLQQFRGWGVGLRSYQEPYLDTTSPFGEALFYITMAYAQLERGILQERVKAGMERAKREGKAIGRPRAEVDLDKARALMDQGASLRSAAKKLKVSPTTLSKILAG